MKIFTMAGCFEVGEGITTTDKRGNKWESLTVEGAQNCPVGKETQNTIGEEELEEILRKEGMYNE